MLVARVVRYVAETRGNPLDMRVRSRFVTQSY